MKRKTFMFPATCVLQSAVADTCARLGEDEPLLLSFLQIAVLLAMLHGGARPNSKTSKELSKALTGSKKTTAQCIALHYVNMWRNLKMDPALKTGIGVYVDGDQSTLTNKYRKITSLYGGTLRGLQFSKDSRSSANVSYLIQYIVFYFHLRFSRQSTPTLKDRRTKR